MFNPLVVGLLIVTYYFAWVGFFYWWRRATVISRERDSYKRAYTVLSGNYEHILHKHYDERIR